MGSALSVLSPLQKDGLIAIAVVIAVACVGAMLKRVAFGFLHRFANERADGVVSAVARRASAPCEFVFPLVAVEFALLAVVLPDWIKTPAEQTLALCITAAFAWGLVALVELAADLFKRRYRLDDEDNLHARQAETRIGILSRTASSVILLVAVSIMLMTFPAIRAVGATLLASAGLLGLAVGFAARPFFENLVAGVQIALTQPIKIDDVVIVESEYGKIEKITATYVVVRLWDRRRMILPLTYFIDKPFQNWTYDSASLTGSVKLYLDYSVPLQAIVDETHRLLERAPLWDRQVVNVAITDALKEGVVEIRILVSARNSPQLFDLRCAVRAGLIGFVLANYPDAFPSTRVQVARDASPSERERSAGQSSVLTAPPEFR